MKTITISFFPLQKQQSLRKEPLENTYSLPKNAPAQYAGAKTEEEMRGWF